MLVRFVWWNPSKNAHATKSDHMVVINLLTSVSVATEKPSYNASSFCLVEPFEECARGKFACIAETAYTLTDNIEAVGHGWTPRVYDFLGFGIFLTQQKKQ
jgi:hypothetical protein